MTSLVRQAKLQAFTAGCVTAAALYVYTKVGCGCRGAGESRHARFLDERRRVLGGSGGFDAVH